jgi:pilus assembly protein CpaF
VLPAVAASVDLVAHCRRDPSGRRRVVEIVEPTGVAGATVEARTVYRADAA